MLQDTPGDCAVPLAHGPFASGPGTTCSCASYPSSAGSSATCTLADNLSSRQSEMYLRSCCVNSRECPCVPSLKASWAGRGFDGANVTRASSSLVHGDGCSNGAVENPRIVTPEGHRRPVLLFSVRGAATERPTPFLMRKHSFGLCMCLRSIVSRDECKSAAKAERGKVIWYQSRGLIVYGEGWMNKWLVVNNKSVIQINW